MTAYECECGQFEHMGIFLLPCAQVMDVLNLAEIPEKHIVKCWKKDAGDILPRHLVHYQKNGAVNHSFTCRHSTVTYKRLILLK